MSVPTDSSDPVLQAQFARWCGYLQRAGIFTNRTVGLLYRHNSRATETVARWNLEHYDAMPWNFVVGRDKGFASVDEKHLLVGPRGISLVKPMWVLPAAVYSRLSAMYQSQIATPELHDPQYLQYLEFYYLVHSLACNAADRSLLSNLSVLQFHGRRDKLLRMIDAPASLRRREKAAWLAGYAGVRAYRRLRRLLRHAFGVPPGTR